MILNLVKKGGEWCMNDELNRAILTAWEAYTMTFTLTMSEETLIKHFCEYFLRVADVNGDGL